MRIPHISIRTNILGSFLTIFSILSASFLALIYFSSLELAQDAATKSFKQASNSIAGYTQQSTQGVINLLSVLKDNDLIEHQIKTNTLHPMYQSLHNVMVNRPHILNIYIAQDNGDFYELINLNGEHDLHHYFNAPKDSTFVSATITSLGDARFVHYKFLDASNKVIGKKTEKSTYDPRTRPWYIEATKSQKVVRTEPYLFDHPKQMGLSYSVKKGHTVLALDITVNETQAFLASQVLNKDNEIVLFNQLAIPFVSSSKVVPKKLPTTIKKAFYDGNIDEVIKFKEKGRSYFGIITVLKNSMNSAHFLYISIPKDVILAPYISKIKTTLYILLAILLLTLPLIFYISRLITKPIFALINENEEIKHRRYHDVKAIQTHIIEFQLLSDSQVEMSHEIQAYQKSQEEFLDAIVKLIAEAIDAKSAYTGGHCKRVPQIAEILLKAANSDKEGAFKDFSFEGKDAWREFEIGAWLHDCGKVTTPEYVVDKATKLETIHNRIHEIRTRFEVLWRDAEITSLQAQLQGEDKEAQLQILQETQKQLLEDFEFIALSNMGGEFMSTEKQERIRTIGAKTWQRHFDDRLGLSDEELLRYEELAKSKLPATENLLADKPEHIVTRKHFDYDSYKAMGFKEAVPKHLYNYGEIYNLTLAKGTLTPEERYKINEHVIMSIKMLEQLPFPKTMSKIPEYAGTHHETLIGTGYPRQLTKDELSIPARIMAIADIFEALTASDRPYKKAKTLSESLKIMHFMVKDQHIDPDLFALFLHSGAYLEYANTFLKEEQIDTVNIEEYLV